MSKSNYGKIILIISFCIFFLMVSVFANIIANDILHTHICDVPNCPICTCIGISNNFEKNIALISINILLLASSIPLVQLITENIERTRKITLVELKVIQIK